MLIRATAFAVLLVIAGTEGAAAITCSSRPMLYGTWREVDGRRCWYLGRRMVSKSILHWRSRERTERRYAKKRTRYERVVSRRMLRAMPMPTEIVEEREEGEMWPSPPTMTVFEWRFLNHWPTPTSSRTTTPFEQRFLGK